MPFEFPGIEVNELNGNYQDPIFNALDNDMNKGGIGNFLRGENSNRGAANAGGGGIFDDMDEFVENTNGNNNMWQDDDVMDDNNCFLSPANQYYSNTNQNSNLLGIEDNNVDADLNP